MSRHLPHLCWINNHARIDQGIVHWISHHIRGFQYKSGLYVVELISILKVSNHPAKPYTLAPILPSTTLGVCTLKPTGSPQRNQDYQMCDDPPKHMFRSGGNQNWNPKTHRNTRLVLAVVHYNEEKTFLLLNTVQCSLLSKWNVVFRAVQCKHMVVSGQPATHTVGAYPSCSYAGHW